MTIEEQLKLEKISELETKIKKAEFDKASWQNVKKTYAQYLHDDKKMIGKTTQDKQAKIDEAQDKIDGLDNEISRLQNELKSLNT